MKSSLSLKILCSFLLLSSVKADSNWEYDLHSNTGPSKWGEKYKQCNGQSQSPIDIQPADVFIDASVEPFKFNDVYSKLFSGLTVLNNGHTVQINIPDGFNGIVSGGGLGDNYRLKQFHFHWGHNNDEGSEHRLGKLAYPLELHLVHFNQKYAETEVLSKPDGLAVIGVFFHLENGAKLLDNLVQSIRAVTSRPSNTTMDSLKIDDLLPSDRSSFYRYQGSLTTPPCAEVVTWTVLTQSLPVSPEQMNIFRSLREDDRGTVLEGNDRPIQPLNGRKVRLIRSKENVIGSAKGNNAEKYFSCFYLTFLLALISCRLL